MILERTVAQLSLNFGELVKTFDARKAVSNWSLSRLDFSLRLTPSVTPFALIYLFICLLLSPLYPVSPPPWGRHASYSYRE